MPPSKPVGGKPPHRRPGPHEDTLPMLGMHEPFALEDGEGVTDGHPRHSVMLDEVSLGRQLVPLPEPATVDGLAQLVGNLPEYRTITRGIEIAKNPGRHRGHFEYSFRYLDKWPSVVATVGNAASREGRET